MEVIGGRRVRSVKEYLYLFPRPTGNDIVIKKSADVGDTVHFIQGKARQASWQTKKFAKHIKGRDLDETCKKIWQWLYHHIPYKKDEEGVEQIRSPRRLVYEGSKTGVDCDCYSFFISCSLLELKIPHKYRITKYEKLNGDTPRWQHIYIVVPKNGKLNHELKDRNDYIVIDCVKENYDDEEPYLEFKDYNADMRLDYLDGLDGEETYEVPKITDVQDIAALYDEEELGKVGQWLKKTVKKVVHAANRFTNPGTIALRNAFLLGMKVNFLNVPKRLRYAYLSDEEARKRGMNLSELAKLRKVKDKAENIYWHAGGKKDKLKLAILKGKGNKDKQVPLAGLGSIDTIYADRDEYNIIHSTNGLSGLGVISETMAVVTPIFTALAAALKSAKGLFPKGKGQSESMESDKDAEASAAMSTASQQSLVQDTEESASLPQVPVQSASIMRTDTPVQQQLPVSQNSMMPADTSVQTSNTNTEVTTAADSASTEAAPTDKSTDKPVDNSKPEDKPSLFKNPIEWAKKNPIPAGLIMLGMGYMGYRLLTRNNNQSMSGDLSGTETKKKRRTTNSKKKKPGNSKKKVRAIVI